MKLTSLPQYAKNAMRFTEIVSILFKYGLANWIKEKDPEFIKGLFRSSKGVKLSELTQEARSCFQPLYRYKLRCLALCPHL